MTLPSLIRHIFWHREDPKEQANAQFSAAFRAHRQAVQSGDTRLQHDTRQALSKAQRARLECGA